MKKANSTKKTFVKVAEAAVAATSTYICMGTQLQQAKRSVHEAMQCVNDFCAVNIEDPSQFTAQALENTKEVTQRLNPSVAISGTTVSPKPSASPIFVEYSLP